LIEKSFKATAHRISAERVWPAEDGFTLVEIVAVLVILSVLAALSLPRFINLDQGASRQAVVAGVAQLNSREVMTWSRIKMSDAGWVDDAQVFTELDKNLGNDYRWSPLPAAGGGNLSFRDFSSSLTRTPSTATSPGRWEML
jgi:prepilin-type N-terminal cleavage/methylation domain-containing protein